MSASPMKRRESSVIFERLVRGEATAREYCEQVRREARERVRQLRKWGRNVG